MGSSWEKSLGTLVKLKDKFVFFLEVVVLVFGGTPLVFLKMKPQFGLGSQFSYGRLDDLP